MDSGYQMEGGAPHLPDGSLAPWEEKSDPFSPRGVDPQAQSRKHIARLNRGSTLPQQVAFTQRHGQGCRGRESPQNRGAKSRGGRLDDHSKAGLPHDGLPGEMGEANKTA